MFGAYVNGFMRNSVESLDMATLSQGWLIVSLPEKSFAPRYKAAVFQVNRRELCILGGQERKDCYLYCVRTGKMR